MKKYLFYGLTAIIIAIVLSSCCGSSDYNYNEPPTVLPIKLVVNYKSSVEELIIDGDYSVGRGINSNNFFQEYVKTDSLGNIIMMPVACEAYLITFHSPAIISFDSVMHWIKKNGMRPASLKELQTLAIQLPHLQDQSQIVALGSCSIIIDSNRLFPCLGRYRSRHSYHRYLRLYDWANVCNKNPQFLAFRND